MAFKRLDDDLVASPQLSLNNVNCAVREGYRSIILTCLAQSVSKTGELLIKRKGGL